MSGGSQEHLIAAPESIIQILIMLWTHQRLRSRQRSNNLISKYRRPIFKAVPPLDLCTNIIRTRTCSPLLLHMCPTVGMAFVQFIHPQERDSYNVCFGPGCLLGGSKYGRRWAFDEDTNICMSNGRLCGHVEGDGISRVHKGNTLGSHYYYYYGLSRLCMPNLGICNI